MSNSYWIEQEKKFFYAIKDIDIPNATLDNVDSVLVKNQNDLEKISVGGGCYWIWTNEPINHSLHKHPTPELLDAGEIIYNGIAKDNVKGRVLHHLFGFEDAGWSGISIDIYTKHSISHRKKACSPNGKVPYVNKKPIRNKTDLLKLYLSEKERDYISFSNEEVFYFRNGINIMDSKHINFNFKVHFITGLSSLYLEHIEKQWRSFGLPKLCSYSTGR